MHSTTVHLSDAIDESHALIDQAREAYHELEAFAIDEYGTVEAAPDVVYARLQMYEQTKANMEGRISIIERTLESWGGPTQDDSGAWTGDGFDLQMLSGIQAAEIEDRVGAAGAAMQQDVGAAPRDMSGERVTEVLGACIVGEPDIGPANVPAGVDPTSDPPTLAAYPKPVMLWLYEKANNLNTAGNPNFESTGFGDRTASPDGAATVPTSSE